MPAPLRIDLYSDTQTRPGPGMREAMANAPVGDEQLGEDPSVNRLCELTAALLGKPAAMFLPSGTMCNAIAVLVHCQPGDEIVCERAAHLYSTESAGAAALAGAQILPLDGERGMFSVAQLKAAIRPAKRNAPRTRLVEFEQTVNRGGGAVWPLTALTAVAREAQVHGLVVHMDGARLLNAVVASGVAAHGYAALCDSVWLDLSKGLGCPVGAVLAGSVEFIERAWRWKHRLGGAMRQAGILAAAGIYALEHNVTRLAEDHENARLFADAIATLPGIALDPATVETNIVIFGVQGTGLTAPQIRDALREHGVRIGAENDLRMRAVTHLDVSRDDVLEAVERLRQTVRSA